MSGFKIEGIEKLQAKLKKNVQMDDVKRVVKTNGAQLKKKWLEMLISLRDIKPEQLNEVLLVI